MAFGIDDDTGKTIGVAQDEIEKIVGQLANCGRDALEPPIVIDHAVIDWDATPILLVHIPEQPVKPVHRRGKSIEHAWVRSGGSTRKASRQEVGAMLMNSRTPRWEELRASSWLQFDEVVNKLDVAAIAKLLERPMPVDDEAMMDWLASEKMIESAGEGAYVTHFGAVAAARELRPFDTLQRKRIRVIRYSGLNKVNTIDEMVGQKGYAVGFEGLMAI